MCGTAVDEPWGNRLAGELGAPVIEAGEKVRGDGFPGFDFDGLEGVGSGFDEGVDFVAFLVAEKVKRGLDASVGLGFEQLGHDPIFEKGSALWMSGDVAGGADAYKPRGEAGITEIEFRGLDEALVEIGEPWLDQENQVAGLEDREPGLGGDASDAGIRCEGVDVDQLADASRAELDEALEGSEILDFENLPHIPLKIGADVVLEPEGGFNRAVVDGREEPGVKKLVHRVWGAVGGLEFRHREGQKSEHGCASGEALGDRLDQLKLTGSSEDEASHPPVGIDDSLEIREEFGDSLDFVEDSSVRGLAQESAWVFSGKCPGVRVFKGKVWEFRGEKTGQRCFS
jgi:hypothetical protein